MGKELTLEQLQASLAAAQNELQAKGEEISSLKAESEAKSTEISSLKAELEQKDSAIESLKSEIDAKDEEIESSVVEIAKLQKQLENVNITTGKEKKIVEVFGKKYKVLHGGSGFDVYAKFSIDDIIENAELAEKLVKIGFGGLELISND